MKRIILLLNCLATMPLGVQAGEIYRWVEPSGIVHYSDVPSADAEKISTRKFSEADTPGENLPYETLRAQQNFPVTLYTANGCGAPCDQARSLLSKRGVPFSEKLLKTQEEIDTFFKTSGSNGAPTLAIGKVYLSGFQEAKWNGELDVAGYPKTATYRQLIAPPSKPSAPETPPDGGQAATSEPAPAEPAAE
ncbi:MAG: hypothetical protein A3H31_07830 [Gallionellales bacterium RIFCSPLOWO2_02_FULL_57_47]|nr:MAG: hypothetical protein A3H31_07830 [Gallionellales bacterium RIFCSPLOWO2_02_FULL_57_47]OGT09056.1 MAG: hypothetical protein A3J49_01690 [Gallionellales bacterium RIFCSPHIGHO2_02_FULL_57_16]